ncbi:hypothetical protein ACH47Z_39760 [Streptomyces sp. NPDC020192]|uniref:hypothetical protein n=1 Tax=Streptomyces sp. NPDC020192 TaxID=3365066 RepID=UPI0037A4065D
MSAAAWVGTGAETAGEDPFADPEHFSIDDQLVVLTLEAHFPDQEVEPPNIGIDNVELLNFPALL